MSKRSVRHLSFTPRIKGFWDGFGHGLSASNDVFDVPLVSYSIRRGPPSLLDGEAFSNDVERAKARFTSEFGRRSRFVETG